VVTPTVLNSVLPNNQIVLDKEWLDFKKDVLDIFQQHLVSQVDDTVPLETNFLKAFTTPTCCTCIESCCIFMKHAGSLGIVGL
jgi:hypothetical protein